MFCCLSLWQMVPTRLSSSLLWSTVSCVGTRPQVSSWRCVFDLMLFLGLCVRTCCNGPPACPQGATMERWAVRAARASSSVASGRTWCTRAGDPESVSSTSTTGTAASTVDCNAASTWAWSRTVSNPLASTPAVWLWQQNVRGSGRQRAWPQNQKRVVFVLFPVS